MKGLLVAVILGLALWLPSTAPCAHASASASEIPATEPWIEHGQAQNVAPIKVEADKLITASMFVIIILVTLRVVWWAAKRSKTTADFYAARSAITGTQNGWALAGDYMSAASFLGLAGLISLYGYDGFMYSVGWLVAYVTVLLIVAEPCRNAGKYTMGDILAFRSSPRPVRAAAAFSTVAISVFYLIAQMVGAGKLMELCLGIPFVYSVTGVGILSMLYVVGGGMIATTWVQIIKAVLLVAAAAVLCVLVAAEAGFNPIRFFADVANSAQIQDWVRLELLKDTVTRPGFNYGQRFLEPGLLLQDVWDQISLGMALVLGTAGMPHILMRFFTVPTAQAARKSVIIAMFIIGAFFIMSSILGLGSALYVSPQVISNQGEGGNMANLLLAQKLGYAIKPLFGDVLLALLCAVTFVTIVAVVAGLVLATSAAISHDIYVGVIRGGSANQDEQVNAARITSLIVGALAVVLGMVSERQNVAHLVALAFAVAASGNLPTVVLSLFWRRMNTAGIVAGLIVGTVVSVGLVLVSPNMTYPKLEAQDDLKIIEAIQQKEHAGGKLTEGEKADMAKATESYEKNKRLTVSIIGLEKPIFPLRHPGIVSIPLGFMAAMVVALLFPSKQSEGAFDELYVRQNTGLGITEPRDD
jgi:cation/acetate symporter